ncbi:MAG: ACP S-malonyltransferase [Kofleriaceae bacterium]
MTLVAMFPGQSSRYPEMLAKLRGEPACARVLAEASDLLGRDLAAHYRGNDVFATNRDVQVGVFLANHVHLQMFLDAGITFRHSLGLSLGEYNHLVHIGALDFADAVRLVDDRGRLYDEARDGVMVSVFPLGAEAVEAAIQRLGLGERAAIGLYNSPRQQVISGERSAVDALLTELERDEYFDATVIEPRIPMHAPCFAVTASRFAEVLASVTFSPPRVPYVPNVRGAVLASATSTDIRECLVAHVYRPVRWQASVDAIAASVREPWFVEVGPRDVLHNLFGKDWMPGKRARSDSALEGRGHFTMLIAELRDAC